ncbi:MAG: polymorphic toxin type 50 domain-containing protein [Clostridiales bacterium]|nr:polymorphic toxin type 50 domain-containing protein [Clostridiales bacterium]MDY2835656.1 polymorphic toxin type 50 domain-containing protein [Candidatus Aphodomonas sp.]
MTHAEFSQGVEQGEINTALRRKNGLNKHDRRSSEYNRHNQQRQKKEKKPPVSYFTVPDPAALRDTILSDAVQQKAKTLKFPDGTIKQTVRLEFPVGIAYNKKREKIETHWMQVEYAKKHGMHYYPIVPLPGRSDAD